MAYERTNLPGGSSASPVRRRTREVPAAPPNLEGGYDPEFFDHLTAVEDRHFWFVCRNELISHMTRKPGIQPGVGSLILEAGCGTGNVLRFLSEAAPHSAVIGMDMWREGLRHARNRTNCMLVQGDLRTSPFSRPVDLLGMFDVLEHLPDDGATLLDAYSMLRPGGTLLLTVPAHMSLWSYFDEASHHCRRYAADELRTKLITAGFDVVFLTHFMASIFPLVWLVRRVFGQSESPNGDRAQRSLHRAEQDLKIVPVVNSILRFVTRLENRWVASGRTFPWGTSLLAVARRPL